MNRLATLTDGVFRLHKFKKSSQNPDIYLYKDPNRDYTLVMYASQYNTYYTIYVFLIAVIVLLFVILFIFPFVPNLYPTQLPSYPYISLLRRYGPNNDSRQFTSYYNLRTIVDEWRKERISLQKWSFTYFDSKKDLLQDTKRALSILEECTLDYNHRSYPDLMLIPQVQDIIREIRPRHPQANPNEEPPYEILFTLQYRLPDTREYTQSSKGYPLEEGLKLIYTKFNRDHQPALLIIKDDHSKTFLYKLQIVKRTTLRRAYNYMLRGFHPNRYINFKKFQTDDNNTVYHDIHNFGTEIMNVIPINKVKEILENEGVPVAENANHQEVFLSFLNRILMHHT
ncbi:hypothetical protein EBS02_10435 [bacterium]|nr:hypothetical protein [bacterium]